jgi:hypothetical protein
MTVEEALTFTVGFGFTVKDIVDVLVQLFAAVPVTV